MTGDRPPKETPERAQDPTGASDYQTNGTLQCTPHVHRVQVVARRRYCSTCGVAFFAEHPKHDLCVACHKWFRIRWLSAELSSLMREGPAA